MSFIMPNQGPFGLLCEGLRGQWRVNQETAVFVGEFNRIFVKTEDGKPR